MLISYNFLADYVDLSGISLTELCDKLTQAGIEVEAVTPLNVIPDGVVVAEIRKRDKHPNADKLSVCTVFDGEKELQIVCGAPNCDAGKKVPLATLGTKFPDGDGVFEIKKAKLRGVESFGMMCSARELGLSENHDGLLELPADTTVGAPVKELYKPDYRIEVEVTPNHPDWLSVWGIARDVSCLFSSPAKLPEFTYPAAKTKIDLPDNLVTVEAPDICTRYIGQVIRNVKIGESPEWLKRRLISVGLRPINNVVDVTNFVMMELGQPLHAFDYETIAEGRIVVRRAHSGEKMELLNGVTVELTEKNLVICDAEKPRALAGIMGGSQSGISDCTTMVLLESAVFNASNIRASSRQLGVSSDSSYRYERGIDFNMAEIAARRAAQLICDLAGGEVVSDFFDVQGEKPAEVRVKCNFDHIRKAIGGYVANEEMVDIFHRLQMTTEDMSSEGCTVIPPSFRPDILCEADLVEEVARIRGLDAIPVIPVNAKIVNSISDDARILDSELRDQVIGLGLFECMNYSMVSVKSALSDTRFKEADLVKILNPMSLELAWMRPSLWGEMLASVERNISRRNLDLALFEQGRVFCANGELYPEERQELCIMLTGRRGSELYDSGNYDFYDLKGMIENLLNKRKVLNYEFVAADDGRFERGRCAALLVDGKVIGHLGEVASSVTASWRTSAPLFGATIEVAGLMAAKTAGMAVESVSLYPATNRDVAFIAPDELTHADIVKFIEKLKLPNFEAVRLFDVFADEKVLGAGKKSMAYRVVFRNRERTLKDEEVNAAFEKMRKRLAADLNVVLR